MSFPGKLESLDQANVQKLVDSIAYKNIQLDRDEQKLEESLIKLTEYFSIVTPEKDTEGNPIPVPYQFELKNHQYFKTLTIPISRSLWAVTKVVTHLRMELYSMETPMPNMAPNFLSKPEGDIKGILSTLKDIGKKIYRDQNSPYSATKSQLDSFVELNEKWANMLHHFELSFRNRQRLQTRKELDLVLNDLVIVYNAYIEPNLVQLVHHANLILKSETETKIVQLLTEYNRMAERREKMMLQLGQMPQNN